MLLRSSSVGLQMESGRPPESVPRSIVGRTTGNRNGKCLEPELTPTVKDAFLGPVEHRNQGARRRDRPTPM